VDLDSASQDKAVVGTTVADLMKFFDPAVFSKMNDSPKVTPPRLTLLTVQGFYTMMRTLFATLDREEEAAAVEAAENYTPLPSFGDSKSDPKHVVREFYAAWVGFSSVKSFSWLDRWRYGDAPDRRVKRAMEKENKRYRDAGRREFNDTVKVRQLYQQTLMSQSLVLFIRKRDPRYVKETVDEAKLQASLLAASQSQAARAKAAFQENISSFQTQNWMQAEEMLEETEDEEESEIDEQFECVACRKVYKNEKLTQARNPTDSWCRQFQAHLKGKKHIKAVQALRREMREEDAILDYSDDAVMNDPPVPHPMNADGDEVDTLHHDAPHHDAFDVNIDHEPVEDDHRDEKTLNERDADSEIGENHADGEKELPPTNDPDDDSETELERKLDNLYVGHDKKDRKQLHIDNKPKIGAAKAKREKRAEKMAALEAEGKAPPKSSKSRRHIDPSAAMQKARGETATSGRKQGKKK
jgi:DnaJ homolog subfamily A member 5